MKIVILQDYLRGGGTEHQSVFLAQGFAQRGHDTCVITFRPGGVLAESLHNSTARHRVLQPLDSRLNFWAPGLLKALREEAPDIILLMGRMANNQAFKIRHALPDSRLVATVRTGKPLPSKNIQAASIADAVIVNSHWWADRLAQDIPEQRRIRVIPNAFFRQWPETLEPEQRAATRRNIHVPDQDCVFVDVAGFRKGKKQANLLRACASLNSPNWRLWLVGDGPERTDCEALAQSLKISDRVTFFGFQKDPLPWLQAADVAVSASEEDALPNFLVEAQWLGLPVVAVDYRGVGECFQHKTSGLLVPPGDTPALVKAMAHYQHDPQARLAAGAAGQARAHKHYASESNLDEYLSFFHSLLAEGK